MEQHKYALLHPRLLDLTSSPALLWYDYILTLPLEIRYIWGRKFRVTTALYFFCRYALLDNVLYLLAVSNKLPEVM